MRVAKPNRKNKNKRRRMNYFKWGKSQFKAKDKREMAIEDDRGDGEKA